MTNGGREESNGNLFARFVRNFLSPGYASRIHVTDADKELERLEQATGTNAAPTRRGYTITVDGEKVRLDAEQYEAYARKYGQQAAMMMTALMASDVYAGMKDADKIAALKNIDRLADEYGKQAAGVGYEIQVGDGEKKLFDLTNAGIPIAEAYAAKIYNQQLREDETLSTTQMAEQYRNWVSKQTWTSEQQQTVLEAYGTFWQMVGSQTDKYDEMVAGGISSDAAVALNEKIRALQPETKSDGSKYANVRDVQKWELIVQTLPQSEWDTAMKAYMSGDAYEKYQKYVHNAGMTARQYVSFVRARDTYAGGSWSQKELKTWLSGSGYTSAQKSAIWTITFPDAKTNPY